MKDNERGAGEIRLALIIIAAILLAAWLLTHVDLFVH